MLAEHLHDASVRGQLAVVGVLREGLSNEEIEHAQADVVNFAHGEPDLLTDLVEGLKRVGLRLVRPEDPKIAHVLPHDIAQEGAKGGDVARLGHARFLDLDREPLLFELPPLPPGERWLRLVDTALAPPDDLADPPSPLPPDHNEYRLEARSSVILIAGRA
jgi:hypothetical protein